MIAARALTPRTRLQRAGACCTCIAALLCAWLAPSSHARDGDARVLTEYLARAANRLEAPARSALTRIDDTPRRLLAARSYLRADSNLTQRWSWSKAQIEAFSGSQEHGALLAEIERVREAFERQNPGYTLYANTQVRSFDLQLERWIANAGVAKTALHLQRAVDVELRAGAYPAIPDAAAIDRFVAFLEGWRPPVAAPLAAPGLSMHGQSRAVDFQIVKAGRIVAGTQIASVRNVWERQGWARKLQLAVAGRGFAGPLKSPNEPWHYEYAPTARHAGDVAKVSAFAGQ
jgi:hypothetical protein